LEHCRFHLPLAEQAFGLDFIGPFGIAQNVTRESDGLGLAAFELGAGEFHAHRITRRNRE